MKHMTVPELYIQTHLDGRLRHNKKALVSWSYGHSSLLYFKSKQTNKKPAFLFLSLFSSWNRFGRIPFLARSVHVLPDIYKDGKARDSQDSHQAHTQDGWVALPLPQHRFCKGWPGWLCSIWLPMTFLAKDSLWEATRNSTTVSNSQHSWTWLPTSLRSLHPVQQLVICPCILASRITTASAGLPSGSLWAQQNAVQTVKKCFCFFLLNKHLPGG